MSETTAQHTDATQSATNLKDQRAISFHSHILADPLFILTLPRSFSSIVGAMLGQHPAMYGLPELNLFSAETMTEWWDMASQATFNMAHGLLRTVAQLYFGEQTEASVKGARGWLMRRSHFTTGMMLETLAERVHPLILVYKSPSMSYTVPLQRAYRMFPHARFLHLVRHPIGYGESVMKAIERHGALPSSHWLLYLASFPSAPAGEGEMPKYNQDIDPQRSWHALHTNICEFLESVPDHQKMRIRGEELLTDPDRGLQDIARWTGLRTEPEAIEKMKQPQDSPYACYGPPSARFGNDSLFLDNPVLRPDRAEPHTLHGALSWREDDRELLPKVRRLAEEFGYE
jgi:Sulfotransferase family